MCANNNRTNSKYFEFDCYYYFCLVQEYASGNVDQQHDETHKVHTYRKIRFNPNPGTHGWIASADKVGLFLLFRLSTSDSALSEKLIQRIQRVQVL